jgi:hypothetical protein
LLVEEVQEQPQVIVEVVVELVVLDILLIQQPILNLENQEHL